MTALDFVAGSIVGFVLAWWLRPKYPACLSCGGLLGALPAPCLCYMRKRRKVPRA